MKILLPWNRSRRWWRKARNIPMNNERQVSLSKRTGDLGRGFEGHRRRQARLGLGLSPAERLRWLEESMEELGRLVGRARQGHLVTPG